MGISIWLVPSSQTRAVLKQVLVRSDRLQKHCNPLTLHDFEPHVTLCSLPGSSPDVAEVLNRALDAVSKPLLCAAARKASFVDAVSGLGPDMPWRSLVFAINPSEELVELKEHVFSAVRGLQSETNLKAPAFPHLSIIYVSDESGKTQEEYLDALGELGILKREGDGAIKVKSSDGVVIDGFEASEAWVVRCEGNVSDWEVLERRPLAL